MASCNTEKPTTASSPYRNAQQQQQQQSQKKGASSCQSCVRLITEILQNPDSRPRQVLQALSGRNTSDPNDFHMEPVADGVQVQMQLPESSRHRLPQRWTRINPPPAQQQEASSLQERVSSTFRRGGSPVAPLATSADTTTTTTTTPLDAANDSAASAKNTPRYRTETIKIECRKCDTNGPEKGARALIMGPTPLSIVACTNRLSLDNTAEMSEVLTHELLHAYDVKQLSLDFTDCESMAYSEVRAAREAECANWNMMKEYCVNQKAIAATHNLFPLAGRNCVRQVFATAYADTRPFDTSTPSSSSSNSHTK